MKIGPFVFEKKNQGAVRCFHLENLAEKEEEQGDGYFVINIKDALNEADVNHLGVWTSDNLWCIEDKDEENKAIKIFERFGLRVSEIDPEAGKRFHRWTFGFEPKQKGDRK